MAPKFGLLALVEAKPGKEQEVRDFLNGGREIVLDEPGTRTWYAFGPAKPPSASLTLLTLRRTGRRISTALFRPRSANTGQQCWQATRTSG